MKDTSSTLKKEIEAAMSRTAFLDLFMTEWMEVMCSWAKMIKLY
jgi:hypothetical protein